MCFSIIKYPSNEACEHKNIEVKTTNTQGTIKEYACKDCGYTYEIDTSD
jgi:transposase-like protein